MAAAIPWSHTSEAEGTVFEEALGEHTAARVLAGVAVVLDAAAYVSARPPRSC